MNEEQTPGMGGEPTPEQPTPEVGSAPSKDECTMAMLCHLLAIFTGFIGPLIIWLMKKDQSPFVDYHGKQALNFQFTVLIASIVSGLLIMIFVGCVTTPIIVIGNLILCIMATMKANSGEMYQYPLAIPFIK